MSKRARADLQGAVVVVTGAASGIGRATAIEFAAVGARVAASDIDEAGLAETADTVQRQGGHIHCARLDVADRGAMGRYAQVVATDLGGARVVVNNAGVTCASTIRDLSYEDFEWVMNIDFWGVVHGTKAFLPQLEVGPWGHVVNVSSVFGLIAFPTQGAYNAAKFAVRGFTECLRQELELAGSTVSATSVHPGGIRTRIAENARIAGADHLVGSRDELTRRFAAIARTSPTDAARAIIRGVLDDAPRVLIGPDAVAIDVGARALPTAYRAVTKAFIRRR